MITDREIWQWANSVIDDHPTRVLRDVALGRRKPILSGYYETGSQETARATIETKLRAMLTGK